MADTRYLKRRRQTWYFYVAVPTELRAKLGKTTITETLGTRDLTKAQKLRWAKQQQWTEAFERLRGNVAMTGAEIEEEAQRVFQSFLARMDSISKEASRDPEAEIEELDKLADLFSDAAEALPRRVDPSVAREIAGIETRTGAALDPGSPTYERLARAITSALLHATLGRKAALQGEAYEPPATFGGLPQIDPLTLRAPRLAKARRTNGQGMRFSEAAERFINELQRDKRAKVTEQTRAQHEAVYRLFTQYTADAALEDITRERAGEFLTEVAKLHPHWGRTPATKKLTVWELLERYGGGEQQLSNRTLNRYVSSLSAVFKWARKRGVFAEANPFAEQGFDEPPPRETQWRAFTAEDLSKLLCSPLMMNVSEEERIRPTRHDMRSVMRWLPLLALYTGMREHELCQLHKADVMQDEGIWFFHVRAEWEGQHLKTEAALRQVPVHSQLVRCGFLDYVAARGDGQLFPALKPGGPDGKLNHYFSKRFTAYRRSVGAARPRTCFHSLRKNAAQSLKNARTTPSEIAELIGHERGFTVETYAPLGLPLPVLKDIVERIEYPRLDLSHLYVAGALTAERSKRKRVMQRHALRAHAE